MTEYTLDVNGKRYELNEEFRAAIQKRAELAYEDNSQFSCWWKVKDGDPILTIETVGPMVPWDNLDQLEVEMGSDDAQEDGLFGRTHFGATPQDFEEVPDPGGADPEKIPPKRERIDDEILVLWVPKHPDVDEIWDTGEAMISTHTFVDWNVQKKADQPRPQKGKQNSHDSFESLCNIHDCKVKSTASPSNDIPDEVSSQVQRKGKESYENGRYGGDNWSI